jgi:hypothetical protein
MRYWPAATPASNASPKISVLAERPNPNEANVCAG